MGRHADLVMRSDNRRPIPLAQRDDTPLALAGFSWNNASRVMAWEIEINGLSWRLAFEAGGIAAKRVLCTATGNATLTVATFAKPLTVAEAKAIRAKLMEFSGGMTL